MELIAEYLGRDLVPFINLEDRVHDLTPAQRLQGLALEDIRDSLSDEERQALRQLLDDQESDTQD
jgi:NAD-specific glutamate dehydrogenase